MKKLMIGFIIVLTALPLHSSFAQKKFVRDPLVESKKGRMPSSSRVKTPRDNVVSSEEWVKKDRNRGGRGYRVEPEKTQGKGAENFRLDGA